MSSQSAFANFLFMDIKHIRNIAIIAHVDHGKTTLVDHLLKQAHTFAAHQVEMTQTTILDSNDLEREKGVTILAKNTAILWKEYKINILDTPGHADFSGEVERVLNMADGCVLLVDAAEGVLSQTRYVLSLALGLNLTPIVIINKVDRQDARVKEVLEEISDLFLELASDSAQLDFPVLYAIGKEGKADTKMPLDSQNLSPLMQTIIDTIPAPKTAEGDGFQMQVTTLDYDDHKGRLSIGKINRGQAKIGDPLVLIDPNGKKVTGRVEYLFAFKGLDKEIAKETHLGDIMAITGFADAKIGDTLTSPDKPEFMASLSIAEPTIQVQISPSTSPFVGQDGKLTTSRQIGQRLNKELETNVGLKLASGSTSEVFIVSGRGELHLAILIETMRREGFEMSVSRPEVIYKQIDGKTHEPWEVLTVEVPETQTGVVIDALGKRKGQMVNMFNLKTGVKLEYKISTANLLGLRSELLSKTSGAALVHSRLLGFEPKGEDATVIRNGALIATEPGQALSYAIHHIQQRAITFVEPGAKVYVGMIVGQNNKPGDMHVNICKGKKLTNMRAATADASIKIAPPVILSLEQSLNFLGSDELLEVTPKNLRLRKKNLNVKH